MLQYDSKYTSPQYLQHVNDDAIVLAPPFELFFLEKSISTLLLYNLFNILSLRSFVTDNIYNLYYLLK
jgi:hypothetical protein